MRQKTFIDGQNKKDTLKVSQSANFVGFEVGGEIVVLSRQQVLTEVLPFLAGAE